MQAGLQFWDHRTAVPPPCLRLGNQLPAAEATRWAHMSVPGCLHHLWEGMVADRSLYYAISCISPCRWLPDIVRQVVKLSDLHRPPPPPPSAGEPWCRIIFGRSKHFPPVECISGDSAWTGLTRVGPLTEPAACESPWPVQFRPHVGLCHRVLQSTVITEGLGNSLSSSLPWGLRYGLIQGTRCASAFRLRSSRLHLPALWPKAPEPFPGFQLTTSVSFLKPNVRNSNNVQVLPLEKCAIMLD